MYNFNGNIIGNNITINGRVITGGETCKFQKFDERKFVDANVEKITID